MERLTLSNNEIHTYIGIWILENGNPKELISDDCDEYEYFKKLAEYEDLEEQGKLLKLPCAVGDTVYVVMPYTGRVKEEVITGVSIKSNVIFMMCDDEYGYSENVFGKTVFLTKSDAETALKEMEGKK